MSTISPSLFACVAFWKFSPTVERSAKMVFCSDCTWGFKRSIGGTIDATPFCASEMALWKLWGAFLSMKVENFSKSLSCAASLDSGPQLGSACRGEMGVLAARLARAKNGSRMAAVENFILTD